MIKPGWFQKDNSAPKRPRLLGGNALPGASEASRLAAKLRPHELIAMLTHHYARVRARSLPRVKITLAVRKPNGEQAVIVACK
jgi:hypothetical protein